jgi:four helix bundle protein
LRAAISVPTNIAEGMGRYSRKEFIQFLIISRGSLEEIKYLIYLSKELEYIEDKTYDLLNESIIILGKKINTLIKSIKRKND